MKWKLIVNANWNRASSSASASWNMRPVYAAGSRLTVVHLRRMQHEVAVAIEATNIVKSYDGRRVLDDASLQVHRHAIVGLLGANGSGKTTLLRILLGLLPADTGTARILGNES